MPRHRRTPVSLYGVNRYASNDNRVSNAIKYRSGGHLLEPLYADALGKNPATTSVQFYCFGINHAL
jgi:hypothetical protein